MASRELPSCDLENPADVEAWWGNFGWGEAWRKVVLATANKHQPKMRPAQPGSQPQGSPISTLIRSDPPRLEDRFVMPLSLTTHQNKKGMR